MTTIMRLATVFVSASAVAASAASAQDLTGKWTATAVSNHISFHVVRTANNATNKILWQGTIEGEEIHFTRSVEDAPGPVMEIIAKRAQ